MLLMEEGLLEPTHDLSRLCPKCSRLRWSFHQPRCLSEQDEQNSPAYPRYVVWLTVAHNHFYSPASRKVQKGQRRTGLSLRGGPSHAHPIDQNSGTRHEQLQVGRVGHRGVLVIRIWRNGYWDMPAASHGDSFVCGSISSLVGNTKMNTLSSLNSEEGHPKGKFR